MTSTRPRPDDAPGTGSTQRMKLPILGATGQTGQQLLAQALEQDHEITALVRNELGRIVGARRP